jgi:hypothetical protein
MAMAGTGGAVNERGSMPTLLNDSKIFHGKRGCQTIFGRPDFVLDKDW